MTNIPTIQPANPSADQSDDVTKALAIRGDYVVTVDLPPAPLTPEERETEIRTLRDNLMGSSADGAPSSPELTALSQDLQRTPETDRVWRYLNPNDNAELDLLVATLLGEAPFDKTAVNEITLRSDGAVLAADFDEAGHRLYYENGDSPINYTFPGRRSQLKDLALNLYGTAFAEFPPVMLVHFDYAPDATFYDDAIMDIVKFGDAHPIIQLIGGRGLVLNCANENPDQTRTTTTVHNILRPIHSARTYYRIAVSPEEVAAGGVVYDNMYFFVPQGVSSGATITINVRFADDGRDAVTVAQTYTITDITRDEVLQNGASFSVGGRPDLVLNISFVANYQGRPVIHLQTPDAVRAVAVYDVTAEYGYERSVNVPDTTDYEQIPLLSGANHMKNGFFDPEYAREFQRDTANKVMLEIKQGHEGYMHVRVVVNGVVKNDGVFYDTRRTAEDMGIPQLKTNAAGGGVFIGGKGVRISRLYIARAQLALAAAQLAQIQTATATPGALYYGLRAANPTYKLDAQLQVQDSAGEFFTVGVNTVGANSGGVNLVLDENGYAKNFLSSPIISTDTESQANSRQIPELLTAKVIAVVCGFMGEIPYSDPSPMEYVGGYVNSAMTLIYRTPNLGLESRPYGIIKNYQKFVVVGGHGYGSGQRYYINIIGDRIYLENVRNPGGNPGIYAIHIYK